MIVANPYRWLNGKRLVFGCIAFAMMLGRLASGGLGGLLFSYVNVGGGSMFLLMPFALALAGLTMIVGIGTIIVFLFGVFVAIPAAIVRQIFAFEYALAVYRYQSHSLASYIYRFILWLRNERLDWRRGTESSS